MSKSFVFKECNDISNCVITAYKGIRYILYDRNFIDAINLKFVLDQHRIDYLVFHLL